MALDAEHMLIPQKRGGAYAFDLSAISFAPSMLLQEGRGNLRALSVISKDNGFLLILDSPDLPQNGSRKPLHECPLEAGVGLDLKFSPPLEHERGCLAVFSLSPWPNLRPKASAVFDGGRDGH